LEQRASYIVLRVLATGEERREDHDRENQQSHHGDGEGDEGPVFSQHCARSLTHGQPILGAATRRRNRISDAAVPPSDTPEAAI
jgi:hypothetical protein